MQAFDIGLMPLFPDQEWDVYKCGLKLIQHLALGIPGIAAPVGVNTEIIDGNRNGYNAQTTSEWVDSLKMLIENPELRKQMGERGRRTVVERYSVAANYPVLRDAMQAALDRCPR
ncbi:MAG: glycosyltransferase [Planctomycetaceae bacterium]